MDNLTEQVVVKKKNAKYRIRLIATIIIAVLIPLTIFILGLTIPFAYLVYISLFTIPFMIYGSWFFISSQKVDYEYALLGSSLNVAKIIAKRKRKLMLQTNIREFTDLFKYDDKKMGSMKLAKVYSAACEEFSEENYVACFHSEARGDCALIFSPDDRFLEAMKPYLNHDIRKKVYTNK